MADFKLNAQVNLQSPSAANLKSVANTIAKGLGKSANIKLKIGGKGLRQLNANLSSLNKSVTTTQAKIQQLGSTYSKTTAQSQNFAKAQQQVSVGAKQASQGIQSASVSLQGFGKNIVKTIKNAAAFSLVAGPIFGVQRALSGAAQEAAEFQKEIVKISQVTGQSVTQLQGLSNTISRLSTELGVNAKQLAETARVIAQTGRGGKELEEILEGLAQSTLAASFGDISSTTEGLIAILGQFNLRGEDTKAILGSINQVSKQFAVESDDLVQAVRRTGAVFNASAGGTKNSIEALQAFNAIFTSVRANTRESSETIAAGLKTIFARLQRRGTIDFLDDFGIKLVATADDAKLLGVAVGDFVGQEEAFRRLSKGLQDTNNAITRSAIVEEIGGIRQIGKLIPAIENFADAEAALAAGARGAAEGLEKDVDKALLTVSKRVEVVQATFTKLIRDVFESDAFQNFAKNILSGTQQLIETFNTLFKAIEPILPLLAALGTFKLASLAAGAKAAAAAAGAAAIATTATAPTTTPKRTRSQVTGGLLGLNTKAPKAPININFRDSFPGLAKAGDKVAKVFNFADKVVQGTTKNLTTVNNAFARVNSTVKTIPAAVGRFTKALKTGVATASSLSSGFLGAGLALGVLASTTVEADSATGQFISTLITGIIGLQLLGPVLANFSAQLATAGAAAQAGTLTGGQAASAAGIIVAAPIIGGIIGNLVGKAIVDNLFPALEKLGSAQGEQGRSLERAIKEGRQKSQIRGGVTGFGAGAGLGGGVGFLLGGPVGAAIGAAIAGAIGGIGGVGVGSLGGGQTAKIQQALFNSNVRLRDASDRLTQAIDKLRQETNTENLKKLNNELASFRKSQSLNIKRQGQFGFQDIEIFEGGFFGSNRLSNAVGAVNEDFAGRGIFGKDFDTRFLNASEASRIINQDLFKKIFDADTLKSSLGGGRNALRDAVLGDIRFFGDGLFDFDGVKFGEDDARKKSAATLAIINDEIANAYINAVKDQDVVGDLGRINEALSIGIEKSFQKIDLSGLDLKDITVDKFDQAIDDAAASGNNFAAQLKRLDAEIASISVSSELQKVFKSVQRDDEGRVSFVSLPANLTGIGGTLGRTEEFSGLGADALITTLARIQEAITDDRSLLDTETGELGKAANRIARLTTAGLRQQGRGTQADKDADRIESLARVLAENLANQVRINKEAEVNAAAALEASKRSREALDSFVETLDNIVGKLKRAASDVDVTADNFQRIGQNLSGRGQLQSLRLNTGIGLGRQGADLRATQLSNISTVTGIETANIRNFNNAISNFSDIARRSAEALRQEGGEVSNQSVVNRILKDFATEINQEVPKALSDALTDAITGVSRQNTSGGIVNLQSFEDAIRKGALSDISDKVFEQLGKTTEELIGQFQDLSDNIVIAVNAQAQLNKQLRDAGLQSIQRRQAGRQQRDQLFGRTPQGLSGAEADLREQLGAILSGVEEGNDLTGQSLLQRRAEIQNNLRLAQERQAEGGLADPTATINEIAALKTELDATTEALDLLSNETGRLSALTAEANKLIAQRESAQQITRGLLQEAVQNGFTVTFEGLEKQLGFIAAAQGEGGVAALSNEQLVGSVEALNTGLSSEIARLQLGDDFKKLQLELDKETAKRLRASLPEGTRSRTSLDAIVNKLQTDRELADIERTMLQIEKDQLTALRKIAGQDVQQATQDLSILKTAIENQANVISNSIEELNTLLTSVKEGDALRVTEKKDTSPATTTTTTTTTAPKVATFEEQVQKEIKRLNDGMFRERRVTQDKTAGLTRLMGGKTLARGVEGASTPTSAILKDGKLVFNNPGGSFLTEADIRKIAEANVKTANAINPPRDPSLIPQGTGAAAGQVKPGEVKAASQANEKSAQALNDAANTLSSATLESTNALAASAQNFNNIAERLDGVAVPETIDVSFSPVNVVGTDQFAQAMEPTLTRIVEESVAKVIAMSLNDRYGGPPVGPGFDPNMA